MLLFVVLVAGAAGASARDEAVVRRQVAEEAAAETGVVGLYVAFDDRALDPYAMAACDDDGDPVVVISEALLTLVDDVSTTIANDAATGGKTTDAYASFLAAEQRPRARLLAPPPGTFDRRAAPVIGARAAAAFVDIVRWIVAREAALHALGFVACPAPTATHEAGDAVWTDDERARAFAAARTRAQKEGAAGARAADRFADERARDRGPESDATRAAFRAFIDRARPALGVYAALHPRP